MLTPWKRSTAKAGHGRGNEGPLDPSQVLVQITKMRNLGEEHIELDSSLAAVHAVLLTVARGYRPRTRALVLAMTGLAHGELRMAATISEESCMC